MNLEPAAPKRSPELPINLCIRVNKRIFCLFSGLVAFALLPARASENPINFDDVIGLRVDVEDSTGEDCSGVGGMDNSR